MCLMPECGVHRDKERQLYIQIYNMHVNRPVLSCKNKGGGGGDTPVPGYSTPGVEYS
jgi:hypothetical protein